MTRDNTAKTSGARQVARNRAGRDLRTHAHRASSPRVMLLCLLLCWAVLLPPSMLASDPRGNSPAGSKGQPTAATVRQTEPPAGLPDLNEARHRPRHEPHAVPPIPSTRRRCPPRNRRCNDDPDGQAKPRPTPAARPRVGQSGQTGNFSFASFAEVSFLAVLAAAINGGSPMVGLPLLDFYGPGGGYSVTDAPTPPLPLFEPPFVDAPTDLHVTSTSDTQVILAWTAASGATNYRVERSADKSWASPALAGASATPGFGDGGRSRAQAYLYRVCAADGANNCVSPYSNIAMGTAITFQDDPLVTASDHQNGLYLDQPLTPIRAAHVTDLRAAIGGVRALAGLSGAQWAVPDQSLLHTLVMAAHVQELRDRLNEALAALGIPAPAYTDPGLGTAPSGTVIIKRAHFKELRDAATRGDAGARGGVGNGTGTGLTGKYYGDIDLTAYRLTRTDATVNFDWGSGSPDPSIPVDNFSVRWSGMVVPRYSEAYTFYTTTDDGVRLWIDGQLIIDKWIDQAPTEWSGQYQFPLQAGRAYSIKMEFYEHGGGATAKLQWASASQAKEVIPQSQLYPCWKDAAQFVSDFYQGALARQPSSSEREEWVGLLDQAEGGDQLVAQAQDLGRTLFNSQEYAARNRSDGDYVSDLYWAYLQRAPDQSGLSYWTGQVASAGRANVRVSFEASLEFQEKSRRLCGTAAASSENGGVGYDFTTARLDPNNRTGDGGADPLSRNYNWSIPLVGLPGRAGLDLSLSLSYNSLVWTKDSTGVTFDADDGWPGPGFRLGFPAVEPKFFNPQTGRYSYLLVTPSGARVELRQVGTSNSYESADSSYLQLTDAGGLTLTTTDGTRMIFAPLGGEYHCYQVEDRNGNYISVAYYSDGRIDKVTDTLGRTLTFNYDAYQNLLSITQPWKRETEDSPNGVDESHVWASFGYGEALTLQPLFSNLAVVGDQPGDQIPVLRQVGLSDGSYYKFSYNDWGQVWKVTHYASDSNPAADNHALNYTRLNLPGSDLLGASAQADCPRFTEERTWVENGVMGQSAEVTTSYSAWSPNMAECDITPPVPSDTTDAVVFKEFYATSGWQKGLTTSEETWVNGVKRRWTTLAWTQDDAAAGYPVNPRVTDTLISDSEGNNRHASTSYYAFALPDGVTCHLPQEVTEYGSADTSTPVRTTRTEYDIPNLSQYLGLRIVGLPSYRYVYEGTSSGVLRSKVGYVYDDDSLANYLQATPSQAAQHDLLNYPATFRWRGNVSRVRRYELNPASGAPTGNYTEATSGYYVTGAVAFAADAAGHTTSVGYADSFYQSVNRSYPSYQTYAYPTSVTDPDGFSSSVQYNYDFGAKVRAQGPPPAGQTGGAVLSFVYDGAGRIERQTTVNSGAYVRYLYGASDVVTHSTINNVADEAFTNTVFDGLGRTTAVASNNPGSTGQYKAQVTQYDALGRVAKQSNPAEVDANGTPAGDDSAGWVYTQQTYDWKGRPLVTTNTDGTQRSASYQGCGCAGGEVLTLTDEVGRRQKLYSDPLGRQWKTEVLNSDGSVYSTTESTLNARDQAAFVRQFQGTDQSGVYQETANTYDGYGRLQSSHRPEQDAGTSTVYAYNPDDAVQSVTDARGATATYSYNNRHLVTGISYSAPSGISVPPTVTFSYDAAGNRTQMATAGGAGGSVDYAYDSLSRLQSETRHLAGLSNAYTVGYSYTLGGQLQTITDPSGASVTYNYDMSGRASSVTGTNFGGAGTSNLATSIQYRAWGALKHLTYGSTVNLDLSYDSRLRATQQSLKAPGVPASGQVNRVNDYSYYDDGRMRFMSDEADHRFDRAYSFDHAGRLTQALTGYEARGEATGDLSPYRETFSYDEWSDLTNRTTRNWSQQFGTGPVTYTNGRRPGWIYDAEGNVTYGDGDSGQYDAAGLKTDAAKGLTDVTQAYDGEGRRTKRVETQRSAGPPPFTSTVTTTYDVRSTVLGGLVVESLDANGAKTTGYAYNPAGGLLATDNGQAAIYSTEDPRHTSEQTSWTGGRDAGRTEYDPVGADAGTYNFYQDQPQPDRDLPEHSGVMSEPADGCLADGMADDCRGMALLAVSGAQVYFTYQRQASFIMDYDRETGQPGIRGQWVSQEFDSNTPGHWEVLSFGSDGAFNPLIGEPPAPQNNLSQDCLDALAEAGRTAAAVDRAYANVDVLNKVAGEYNINMLGSKMLAAIAIRESGFINRDETQGGPGRGVFQISVGGVSSKITGDVEASARWVMKNILVPSYRNYEGRGYDEVLSVAGALRNYNHSNRNDETAGLLDAAGNMNDLSIVDNGTAGTEASRYSVIDPKTGRETGETITVGNYVTNVMKIADNCFNR